MRSQGIWSLAYPTLLLFLIAQKAGSVSESAAEFNIARSPAPLFNGAKIRREVIRCFSSIEMHTFSLGSLFVPYDERLILSDVM